MGDWLLWAPLTRLCIHPEKIGKRDLKFSPASCRGYEQILPTPTLRGSHRSIRSITKRLGCLSEPPQHHCYIFTAHKDLLFKTLLFENYGDGSVGQVFDVQAWRYELESPESIEKAHMHVHTHTHTHLHSKNTLLFIIAQMKATLNFSAFPRTW